MLEDLNKTYRLKAEFALSQADPIDNKLWIFNTSSGKHYRLNASSYEILSRIDGKKNLNEIFSECSQLFDVSFEIFVSDAIVFINDCFNKDFFE